MATTRLGAELLKLCESKVNKFEEIKGLLESLSVDQRREVVGYMDKMVSALAAISVAVKACHTYVQYLFGLPIAPYIVIVSCVWDTITVDEVNVFITEGRESVAWGCCEE